MTHVRPIRNISLFAHLIVIGLFLGAALAAAQAPAVRPLAADDVYLMKEVAEPQVSPDGAWIAYTVAGLDREADTVRSAVWMTSWAGGRSVRLTNGPSSESTPRWSPDGRYLAFLAARPAEAKTQVWVLDRRGGEAAQLTDVKGELSDYQWSPDGKRLALVLKEEEKDAGKPAEGAADKRPKPIVVDRYLFKEDVEGYLTGTSRRHLYLYDIESRKLEPLTSGKDFEESRPVWSPDGSRIAFISGPVDARKLTGTSDICVVEARAGAAPRKLRTILNPDRQKLVWSPDGALLAFLHGFELKYQFYNQDRLAVMPVAGGQPRDLTSTLDRNVWQPEFTPDGTALTVFVEDDQRAYLAKVPVAGGPVERLTDGDPVVSEKSTGGGHLAVAAATDSSPTDIYAYDGGRLRRLTAQNDDWLAGVRLGAVEDMSFRSKDGTEVHGLLTKPPSFVAGARYPAILWIHGGPNGQDDHALLFGLYAPQMERQFFAARGYVVLAVNYRGSSGRGAAFTQCIFADWGRREVEDLLAGVDDAVKKGIADPARLGIGGWSYGGILTDYVIASDPRFKAAMSGAGSADQIANYGVDEYVHQYESELGSPWLKPELWTAISYPFFHADRIKTPTLFMGGEKDFNVPIIGSEQMYQALRTLGVPAELVIYPGQYHIFTRPSFIKERLERWGTWFDKYLKSPK
jgi:dipeptidyl aminopeptidase/acylaminoacyl peptidase